MLVIVEHITYYFFWGGFHPLLIIRVFLEYYWNEILSKRTLHRFLKKKKYGRTIKLLRVRFENIPPTDTYTKRMQIRISMSDRNTAWLSGEQTNRSTSKETRKARKPHELIYKQYGNYLVKCDPYRLVKQQHWWLGCSHPVMNAFALHLIGKQQHTGIVIRIYVFSSQHCVSYRSGDLEMFVKKGGVVLSSRFHSS